MSKDIGEGECLAAEDMCEFFRGIDAFATAACGISYNAVEVSCEGLCDRRRLSDS